MLEFDSEKHQYFWNGKRVPGVNQILQELGLAKDFSRVDTFYRDRGIATHKALELYIKGTLDQDSLDPVIVPYFKQGKEWFDKNRNTFRSNPEVKTEVMVYHEEYGFAGTMDLIIDKIYDWKATKEVTKDTELKASLYKLLWPSYEFVALQLDGSEGPCIEHPMEASREMAEAILYLYKWKKEKQK